MSFKPIQELKVSRTLSTGVQVEVGTLAQNRQGVYFQYHENYLGRFGNLSPYALQETLALQQAPAGPHQGLHGVFSDSLPDGWGLLLQDRVFRQHGILPNLLTQMDRLAFVGQGAVGALAYAPNSEYAATTQGQVDLSELGQQAQAVFEGQTGEVLQALVASGSSGGARPKALVYTQAGKPIIAVLNPNRVIKPGWLNLLPQVCPWATRKVFARRCTCSSPSNFNLSPRNTRWFNPARPIASTPGWP
jgi:serine/threonine-protein kinase HipA